MGIDVHAINFLKMAKRRKPLGDTVTIGRQGLHVAESKVRELVTVGNDYVHDAYCEKLLVSQLGADKVESIDNSDYEEANHVHDMNLPLPTHLTGKYDTIIDGGCLEHIFNVAQALKNCSLLCKPGGQIIHILPANNFCGHGFWQFSPELFFSLYSRSHGYQDTEVYLANVADPTAWYQVKTPTNGQRVNVLSSSPLYVMVRTVVIGAEFDHHDTQQSDYTYHWESEAPSLLAPMKETTGWTRRLAAFAPARRLLLPAYRLYQRADRTSRLSERNPGLIRVPVR